jgi:hypothetical protein
MNHDERRRMTFPLRLAVSLRDMAKLFAHRDGVSLNHFISIAVAEKISRLEHETLSERYKASQQQKIASAAEIFKKGFYN